LTFTWARIINSSITGSSYAANVFELGAGSESFTGGGTTNGGSGNNTYLASASTGQATIFANATAGTANELDFTGGVTDEDLWFVQSGKQSQDRTHGIEYERDRQQLVFWRLTTSFKRSRQVG